MRTKRTKIKLFKRLSAWTLTLALIVGLLPVTVFAASGDLTELSISTEEGLTNILDAPAYTISEGLGGGKATYNPTTNTLNLYAVEITGESEGIVVQFSDNSKMLNIELDGQNTIKLTGAESTGINCSGGNLKISENSSGSIDIQAGSKGV